MWSAFRHRTSTPGMSPLGNPSRGRRGRRVGLRQIALEQRVDLDRVGVVEHLALAIERLELRFDRAWRERHLGVEHALARGGERGLLLPAGSTARARPRRSATCRGSRCRRPERRAADKTQHERSAAPRRAFGASCGEPGRLAAAAARRQAGHRQSSRRGRRASAADRSRPCTSMRRALPPVPHSNAAPQRAQARRRSGKPIGGAGIIAALLGVIAGKINHPGVTALRQV